MPDSPRPAEPAAQGQAYVYYRVAEAALADAAALVREFQRNLLAGQPALHHAALQRRPAASEGLVTLMEIYHHAAPLSAPLREQLLRGPEVLQPRLHGVRHLEEFVPCA